jgi:three-Cys-motif partner protein
MVALADYTGREQAYVKHVFLERYLETLFFKTASFYGHIFYVDGFAGPWQSANEQFEDTSFGIALQALRKTKGKLAETGRAVQMTALLVEKDPRAYARLKTVAERFPDITIKTYPADFISAVPELARDIPREAFAFFLIDPKGWRIPLEKLRQLLARPQSQVVFNFMFEFINRAASIDQASVVQGLDELMPLSNWRERLREAGARAGPTGLSGDERKDVLVGAFRESLRQIGVYPYVAEMTVLRPLRDRALYCLVYATRNEVGIQEFRDCQFAALKAQADMRAEGKISHRQSSSGQGEMFESMMELAADKTKAMLEAEKRQAESLLRELVPESPGHISYRRLWALVLSRHAVRRPDVNKICVAMMKRGELVFPDWEEGKRVPQDRYRVQRGNF